MKDVSFNPSEGQTLFPVIEDPNSLSKVSERVNMPNIPTTKGLPGNLEGVQFSDLQKRYQKAVSHVEHLRRQINSCSKGRAGRSKMISLSSQLEEATKRREAVKDLLKSFPVSEYLKTKREHRKSVSREKEKKVNVEDNKPVKNSKPEIESESEYLILSDQEEDSDLENWIRV